MVNVDVCNLTWDSIRDGQIIYEHIKYPKTAKPVLNIKAERLLDKYKGKGYQNYVSPVFTYKHTSTSKKNNKSKTNILKSFTNDFKSFPNIEHQRQYRYSARGSFISRMVDEGHSPYAVAEMAENSPMVIYKHYYKNTNVDDIRNNMNQNW